MIEQLIGEWNCGMDRVSFELAEDELVVRAWSSDEDFILSTATCDGVWAYLVPSNGCRVHQEVMSIGSNEFTARWFNSDGFKGEITYRRVKPTPPISIEGRQGHAYAAGMRAERARVLARLGEEGPLFLRLTERLSSVAHSAQGHHGPYLVPNAAAALLDIIREELEVRDGE